MPRLRHYDKLGTARFITFCCYHRYPLLVVNDAKLFFIKNLELIRSKYKIKIYGYVLMPEHVHLILCPPDNVRLGNLIGILKGRTSKEILFLWRQRYPIELKKYGYIENEWYMKQFWQKRCYDHNCRTSETALEKIKYCHKNPVNRGLVSDPGEWPWSSYNWNRGIQNVPLRMDDIEI
jgi:putative transposase